MLVSARVVESRHSHNTTTRRLFVLRLRLGKIFSITVAQSPPRPPRSCRTTLTSSKAATRRSHLSSVRLAAPSGRAAPSRSASLTPAWALRSGRSTGYC